MGSWKHEVSVNDFSIGETKELSVGKNYLKRLFTAKRCHRGLNPLLKTLGEFTWMTGREVAVEYYTSFNKSSSPRYQVSGFELVVPELGDQGRVSNPRLTGKERTHYFETGKLLYVPLIHIHTHPDIYTIPSIADLEHMIVLSAKSGRVYPINGNTFKLKSAPLGIITGDCNMHFIWRYVGKDEGGDKISEVDIEKALLCSEYSKNPPQSEEEAVEMLEGSGLFKAYFAKRENFEMKTMGKKTIEEIVEKFAPFDVRVQRIE